jgi:hypothetical protein
MYDTSEAYKYSRREDKKQKKEMDSYKFHCYVHIPWLTHNSTCQRIFVLGYSLTEKFVRIRSFRLVECDFILII